MTDERANKPPVEVHGKDYDERVYRKGHPPHRVRNALILIALVVVGTYLAWTKSIPFQSHFELHAVFKNAANIRKDSPVRIAGVNVGKVESVKSVCDNGLTGNCASNYSEERPRLAIAATFSCRSASIAYFRDRRQRTSGRQRASPSTTRLHPRLHV